MNTTRQLSRHPLPRPTLARTVRGSGPGLVLVHGAGGSVEANYGPVLAGLAARHRVVGVDLPGTGTTPRSTGPLEADDLADQLVAAAVEEGLDTFAIAGFSLGGPIAVRATTRHPARVTALVLTASFAQADTRLRLAASTWHDLDASGDRDLLARFLVLAALSLPFLRDLPPALLDDTLSGLAAGIAPGTPEHTDLVGRIDVRADLTSIAVPTLVIQTSADPLVSPDLQRRLAADIPGALLAELDSGHLPMAERPAEWERLIAAFLADQLPGHPDAPRR